MTTINNIDLYRGHRFYNIYMATETSSRSWTTGQKWTVGIALAILLFFLLAEHRAHFLGFLPWLLLIACPLLHVFMHRSHGGHEGHGHGDAASQDGGKKE